MQVRMIDAMRHLQVRHRLALALIIIFVPALLTSLALLWALHESDRALEQTIDSTIDELLPVARLEFHIEQARFELERLRRGGHPTTEWRLVERINQEFSDLQRRSDISSSLAAEIRNAYQGWQRVAPLVGRVQESPQSRPLNLADGVLNTDDHDLQDAITQLQQARAQLLKVIHHRYASERKTEKRYEQTLLAAWLTGAVVVAVLLYVLSASIVKPLLDLENAAVALQTGNYDTRVAVRGQDELTAVGRTFNAMAATVGQTHEQLYNRAMRDPLTGLLNRRGLELALQRGCEASKPLSVVMLDLDHFKQINDSFGHEAGDEALVGLGRHMTRVVRAGDSLGRYGGDEFLMVLPGLDGAAAERVARRLFKQLAQWNIGRRFPVAISIGVADKGRSPIAPSTIIQAADQALYQAKAAGRATVRVVHAV